MCRDIKRPGPMDLSVFVFSGAWGTGNLGRSVRAREQTLYLDGVFELDRALKGFKQERDRTRLVF